jgi:hypothetical protein
MQNVPGWLFWKYTRDAKSRNYAFELNLEEFLSIIKLPCAYCNHPGSNKRRDFIYNGLDRKDNSGGYTKDNIVPCCKDCNRMKTNILTFDEMKAAMAAVIKVRNRE